MSAGGSKSKTTSDLEVREYAGAFGGEAGALKSILNKYIAGTSGLNTPQAVLGAASAAMASGTDYEFQDKLHELIYGGTPQQGTTDSEQAILDQTMAMANTNPTMRGVAPTSAGLQAAIMPQMQGFRQQKIANQQEIIAKILESKGIDYTNRQAGASGLFNLAGLAMPTYISGQRDRTKSMGWGSSYSGPTGGK